MRCVSPPRRVNSAEAASRAKTHLQQRLSGAQAARRGVHSVRRTNFRV